MADSPEIGVVEAGCAISPLALGVAAETGRFTEIPAAEIRPVTFCAILVGKTGVGSVGDAAEVHRVDILAAALPAPAVAVALITGRFAVGPAFQVGAVTGGTVLDRIAVTVRMADFGAGHVMSEADGAVSVVASVGPKRIADLPTTPGREDQAQDRGETEDGCRRRRAAFRAKAHFFLYISYHNYRLDIVKTRPSRCQVFFSARLPARRLTIGRS